MFKKVLAVGFSAVLALSLVACGGSKDNKSKSSKETTTASESEAATVYSVKDEKIKVDSGVIKLADYSQLTVYEDDVKVTDDSYKSQVDYILEQSATYKDTKSAKISSVDKVKVDYTGQIKYKGKKVTFEGGTASDQEIDLGNNSSGYIDGFTKALEGQHKVGDKFTKKLKFPDTYTNNTKIDGKEVKLAGKTVWFTFTIKSISTKSVPKLTDKFVKEKLSDRYGYTTVKEMKKTIRDEIFKTNKTDYIWNHMIEKSKFKEIPDELINDRVDVLVNGLKAQLKASNYTLKDYLSAYGIEDETTLRDQYKSSCESTVKVFLIADAIAADKKISVTDEDVKAYFNGEDTAQYEKQYSKAYINRIVLNNLVIQEIEKNVTVK